MYVRFWGTRGSIAAPGPRTARFGGNTSCVEIRAADGTIVVLDCGTGVRDLGLHLARTAPSPLRVHLFIGHTHWDHIQGFPFFAPAFLAGAEVNIYAPLGFQKSLEEAMAGQMEASYFPVKLKDLRSRIHFTELDEGFFRVGELLVETQYLNHTAPTIAYRMTSGNATVAYVTDHEPFWNPAGTRFDHPGDQRHIAFLRDAHLVIHDAQYTAEEYRGRVGWGHSPIDYVIDIAASAGVRRLALFHHDPTHDDETMDRLQAAASARATERGVTTDVFAAAEGMELEIKGNGAMTTIAESSALRRLPIVGRRVVLVNPDETEIGSIERELAEDSLILLSTPDARTALQRIPEVAPDIVIVASRLPDGDGAALIGPLRSALGRPDFPVLLLTDEPAGALGGTEPAPTDYLARPVSPPMLRTRIRAWLSRTLGTDASRPLPELSSAPSADVSPDVSPAWLTARYVGLLAPMPLFRELPREHLELLAAGAVDQVYAAGHIIIREGAPAESLFVVLSGRVRVTETSRDTQAELVLGELGPGEIVGELGVLRNRPRMATVVAVERTHCLMLSPEKFREAIQTSPPFALGLLQVIAGRLSDADRRLARYAPDPLTGLMSRRAFVDQYRCLAAGARRRRSGGIMLVLDVRELKAINDRFGYAVGDELLKAVAGALLDATRVTDLVARHGGDEFVAFLVDVEPSDVDAVVGRVLGKLADGGARSALPVPLECSVGAAFSTEPPEAPDELFREADLDMRRRDAER